MADVNQNSQAALAWMDNSGNLNTGTIDFLSCHKVQTNTVFSTVPPSKFPTDLPCATRNQSVTLSASITRSGTQPITGEVLFFDNNNEILRGSVSRGVASIATKSLSLGKHNLWAVYTGNNALFGSRSNNTRLVVKNTCP